MNFTTYFSIIKSLPYGCFPISIANAPPSFINYTDFGKYPPLYPGHSILSEYRRTVKHDPEEAEATYRRRYFDEVLGKLYQGDVLHDCMLMARHWVEKNGIRVKQPLFALVCYESPDKFCHRHLVREWIMDVYPKSIDEFSSWRRWQIRKLEV